MQKSKLTLFLEINDLNYVFYICKISEQNNCEVVYNSKMPLDIAAGFPVETPSAVL